MSRLASMLRGGSQWEWRVQNGKLLYTSREKCSIISGYGLPAGNPRFIGTLYWTGALFLNFLEFFDVWSLVCGGILPTTLVPSHQSLLTKLSFVGALLKCFRLYSLGSCIHGLDWKLISPTTGPAHETSGDILYSAIVLVPEQPGFKRTREEIWSLQSPLNPCTWASLLLPIPLYYSISLPLLKILST